MTHPHPRRSTRRVGFVVDHPKRDLPGGAMLAHAFGRIGIETALIPLYDQAVDVPLLGLDALIVNYARPVNLELVRGYRDAGLPVWVLDTEGGILATDGANSPDRLATYIRDSGYGRLLSGYFFWGSTLHQAFQRHSAMPAEHLHLTGCPRFDYTAAKWRELLEFSREDYVLVNMNFPLVNPLFAKSPQAERDTLVAAGWKADYVDRLIEDSERILLEYVALVKRLATRHAGQQFLVRPHPFENADHYHRAFAELPNVLVDGQGSVLNVIQHSRCILHVNCGTSVEAVMLDKLPLSLEFINTEHMAKHSSLPSMVSQPVVNEEELDLLLRDVSGTSARFDYAGRHAQFIQPWFHLNDGDAARRVAQAVASSLDGMPRARPSIRRSMAGSRTGPSLGQRLQSIAGNVLGSQATSTLRSWFDTKRLTKRLDSRLVSTLLDGMARLERAHAARVRRATHPVTGLPLTSLLVIPASPS